MSGPKLVLPEILPDFCPGNKQEENMDANTICALYAIGGFAVAAFCLGLLIGMNI